MNIFNEFTMAVAKRALPLADTLTELPHGVSVSRIAVRGYRDELIDVALIEPSKAKRELPALLLIHGGGFGYDAAPHHIKLAALYAKMANCRVFVPFYHLLPQYPFPAALVDCIKTIHMMHARAGKLLIDPGRIAVAGDSAGGALTANLVNYLGTKEPHIAICGQVLIYPVADVKMDTVSMKTYTKTPFWNAIANRTMLDYYLRGVSKKQLRRAVPMQNELPKTIPDTYVEVAEFDCLRDEGIAYANRLKEAGARVFLTKTKGTFHGYDFFTKDRTTRACIEKRILFLRGVFGMEKPQYREMKYAGLEKRFMKKRRFTGVENLPEGRAEGELIPGCLVLEGGAFRGVYEAGVLDALMENGINMQTVIGVSAGAMNGLNYVARQIGRAGRINLRYRMDDRYVGLHALRENHGIIGFDFVLHKLDEYDTLDMDSVFDEKRRFVAVATDLETGGAVYFDRDSSSDILKAVQASASMPYVSEPVMVDGHICLDGGCSDAVPYRWAIGQGYEKVIVLRTRDIAYRKSGDEFLAKRVNPIMYKKYPEFVEKLKTQNERYNRACDDMEELAKAGRILMLTPDSPPDVSRLERDMEKLGDLYYRGYEDACSHMGEIRQYLGI